MAEVEVKISSAKDLKNVNWRHGPNRPYTIVWVDPNSKATTTVDEQGDISPFWDETLSIPVSGPIDDDTTLFIEIVHAGNEEDTKKLIGSSRLRLKDVLNEARYGERVKRSLQLKRPSGRPHGKVDMKVLIRDPRYRPSDAHYAPPYRVPPPYSAPPPYGDPYAAAPRPYGNPYAAAPPPPVNPYYQAPPVADYSSHPYGQPSYQGSAGYIAPTARKSKFGGMGTGLAVGAVAGVLGGLALSEGIDALEDKIASDAAEKVEHDLGFDGSDW